MGQGRPRPVERLEALLREAGFGRVRRLATRMPMLVQVLVAEAGAGAEAGADKVDNVRVDRAAVASGSPRSASIPRENQV
jgi:hypothetical protein